ncbi:MAG TPA: hypothetical protein VJ783_10960 [Pirellulales bacterium]|nr:hypothetical protein [Pirellulales bacterium]
MAIKQGELRVQKGSVIFGPMTREAFDRLLAEGKIARSDLVSVRGGEWAEIAHFLASAPATDHEDANLRLLAGQRIFSSLTRREVEQLRSAGRVDDDDLLCALNGPWMRVGDFFAPPEAAATAPHGPAPPVASSTVPSGSASIGGATLATPAVASTESSQASAPPRSAPVMQPIPGLSPTPSPPPATGAAFAPLHVMSGAGIGYHSPPPVLPPGVSLSDVWFVRIRGMHSAPLKKHHLRTLFEAHELTSDSPARNANWPDNAWSPVCMIPELTDVAK